MYVYALGDPRTQQIRYIGIANDVYKRYAQHLNHPHKNANKNAWMEEIKGMGAVPTLTILETNIEKTAIYEREKYWIQYYLALNAPLTNSIIPGSTRPSSDKPRSTLPSKESYTLQELFAYLPITLFELSRRSKISNVTLTRMRDGGSSRRDIVNKLLLTMSEIYGQNLNIRNVTGIAAMRNVRLEAGEKKKPSVA